MVLKGGSGTIQSIARTIGRWSEMWKLRTEEWDMGTLDEVRKWSSTEQRDAEIRVGWEIGQDMEREVIKFRSNLVSG